MIHYSCDLCKRELDLRDDVRYVVRMELSQDLESAADGDADDRDYLEEMQDILQQRDEAFEQLSAKLNKQLQFDLCPECARKFAKNPLGRDHGKQFQFSQN